MNEPAQPIGDDIVVDVQADPDACAQVEMPIRLLARPASGFSSRKSRMVLVLPNVGFGGQKPKWTKPANESALTSTTAT
jgi:hypothetical protein